MADNRPVAEFTLSFVSAAVWENSAGGKTRFKVTLTKSYRDGKEWKRTSSLDPADIPYATEVLRQALVWEAEERRRRSKGEGESETTS